MSRTRLLVGGAVALVLVGAGLVALPRALESAGDEAVARALAAPSPAEAAPAWEEAAERYASLGRVPLYDHAAAEATVSLHAAREQQLRAALSPPRRALDVDLALAWIDDLPAEVLPGGDAPEGAARRLDEQRAWLLLVGGRPEQVLARPPLPSPTDEARRRVAALLAGDVAALPGEQLDPGLALLAGQAALRAGTTPASAGAEVDSAGAAVLRVPGLLDGHRYADAVALLRPFVDARDPAAAEALARVLTAWLAADPPGMAVARVSPREAFAEDALALRAALLTAPPASPDWLGAWLSWGELALALDERETAEVALWGALESALPLLAAPVAELPAHARLDAPGAVPPDRVQPLRTAVRDWRQAAEEAGDTADAAALYDAELSLDLLQARAHLQARDLLAARSRISRAARARPGSPVVAAWAVLTDALTEDTADADLSPPLLAALEGPPDAVAAVRAAAEAWLGPAAPLPGVTGPTAVDALRTAVSVPWSPDAGLAATLAAAPADRPLVLAAPGDAPLTVAQALALAHLHARVAVATDEPGADVILARRDALRDAALAADAWGELLGPAAVPAPDAPPPIFQGR